MRFISGILISVIVAVGAQVDFQCPSSKGLFADSIQCDKYYECVDGEAKERLCPDGLVFDETSKRYSRCDQPYNVDCGDRTELQPARGTNDYCPRKNGIFSHPDESNCHTFYVCQDGEYVENKCNGNLHFDENSGTCVWPDKANRGDVCVEEKVALKDGFVCPDHKTNDRSGQIIAHPHYAHDSDCQKFYVCLNGNEPRMYSCDEGEVFNDELKRCDQPKDVPGCEDWYEQSPARK